MEEYRVMVAYLKEELDEKDKLVEMYRKSGRRFYSGCDDIYDSFDDDDWHVFDSYEIEDEEEVYDISYLFEEKGDEQGDGKEGGRNGEDQSGSREKGEGGSGEKQDGMREKLENEKLKETDQSGTKE